MRHVFQCLNFSCQDIGYFMSPGERSYDAIGLMKQLSEHTAAAYADALEVLGNETSGKTVNEGNNKNLSLDQENDHVTHNEQENDHLASNILVRQFFNLLRFFQRLHQCIWSLTNAMVKIVMKCLQFYASFSYQFLMKSNVYTM